VAGLVLLLAASLAAVTVGLVEKARVPVEKARVPVESALVPPAAARADAATALLRTLQQRLLTGSRAQVVALAAPAGGPVSPPPAEALATLYRNARALRVTGVSLHYVGEDRALTTAQRRALGSTGWVGDVRLRWRLAGFDRHTGTTTVAVGLHTLDGRTSFVSAGPVEGRAAPLWLLGPVSVRRTATSLAVVAGARPAATFARLASHAVRDVRRVLPRWRGPLVVEVPGDQRSLDRVLGSASGTYGGIAAVTATADGSTDPRAPVHVFVNPGVFARLGRQGSQIVISHEATHVATGAALSTMPTWLLEGFADYVALLHADLPVRVAAAEILERVRRHGAPVRLPGPAEFAAQNPTLGASYESAWLACRLLARKYGERRLVAFYRGSARASSTTRAFRTVLGTDQSAFTRAWRADLRRLSR
jgi:hypothetical protein